MKSKKAFLLGEYTLKIIIGVLCLLLLVYLLYSLYSNSQNARDLKMAEATLNELAGKMEEARITSESLTLLTPNNWILLNYVENSKKPEVCEDNCVCLCYKLGWISPTAVGIRVTGGDQISVCNELGACKNFDEVISMSPIKLPVDINIKFEDDKFTITK